MVAREDLEQGCETGFIPPILYMMAVNRLVHNTMLTMVNIGGNKGFELLKHDQNCQCREKDNHVNLTENGVSF